MNTIEYPQPEVNELNRPHWDGLQQGRLMFQRCGGCGHAWLPARAHCPRCLAPEPRWEAAGGLARLLSWVVYHAAYHPAFESRLPYNVSLVELQEGPRMLTNVLAPHEQLRAEAELQLQIEHEGELALARFRLVATNPSME